MGYWDRRHGLLDRFQATMPTCKTGCQGRIGTHCERTGGSVTGIDDECPPWKGRSVVSGLRSRSSEAILCVYVQLPGRKACLVLPSFLPFCLPRASLRHNGLRQLPRGTSDTRQPIAVRRWFIALSLPSSSSSFCGFPIDGSSRPSSPAFPRGF